jgi:hypothetical protein
MLLKYFLKDFEMVPVSPIITSVTFVFIFHTRRTSITRSLYLLLLLHVVQILQCHFRPISCHEKLPVSLHISFIIRRS